MIKINLLPREERVKPVVIPTKLILAGLGGVVLLAAMAYGWYRLSGEVSRLENEIVLAKKEQKRLEAVTKEVEKFKADKKRLEEKIKIIDTLVTGQGGPVRLLDEVYKALPPEVWLTAFNKSGKWLELAGVASSNFTVATFLTNLATGSKLLANVDLVQSEKITIENQSVERFSITADVVETKS
jgi:type IV pilus assembly protein PilN